MKALAIMAVATALLGVSGVAVYEWRENKQLSTRVEELETTPDRYLALATSFFEAANEAEAISTLDKLSRVHPEVTSNPEYANLRTKIETAITEKRQVEEKRTAEDARIAKLAEASNGIVAWDSIPELMRLPPNFIGTDFENLFGALVDIHPKPKDEFESEKEYQDRLATAYEDKSVGPYRLDWHFVFTRDNGFRYEPERHGFSMYTPFESGLNWVLLGSRVTGSSSYVGQNAFGATRQIKKTSTVDYYIQFPAWDADFDSTLEAQKPELFIKMDAAEARDAEGALAALYVGKLVPPYERINYDHTDPTLDEPEDITTLGHFIYMKLETIVIYRKDTGAILLRYDIPDTPPPVPSRKESVPTKRGG